MQQQIKSEITRQLIVDKAFSLFYENGFKPTSIEKIMDATQLTKGAFYHHFKNKQEIGLAVISQKVQRRIYEGMIAPLYDEGDAVKILKNVFIKRIQSFSLYEKQHGCPANNLISEIGDTEAVYQQALRRIIEEWKSAIITVIEKGKKANNINHRVDSAAVAVFLISAFEGVRNMRKLYNNDEVLDGYHAALKTYIDQLR